MAQIAKTFAPPCHLAWRVPLRVASRVASRVALSRPEAEAVWQVQQPAYRVEADIIGCADFPPLRECVDAILLAGEDFLLAYDNHQVVGALSCLHGDEGCVICRMVVMPRHFRRGIGRWMLHYLFLSTNPALACRVVTARANHPGIAFYESLGFSPSLHFASKECIDLVLLTHRARAAA